MKQITVGELASVLPVARVVDAWQVFKRTHDIRDAKHCCCEHTLALFRCLEELEHETVVIARGLQ